MSRYFEIQPEVAGQIGEQTIYDQSVYPPRLENLEYMLEDWFGDAILESFPSFIVTDQLATALQEGSLTGFAFADVVVTRSPEFEDRYANKTTGPLPRFRWLKVHEESFVCDMGLDVRRGPQDHSCRLIVSERALTLIRSCGFTMGEVVSRFDV